MGKLNGLIDGQQVATMMLRGSDLLRDKRIHQPLTGRNESSLEPSPATAAL
jgi:hypothetical protein